jgi:DNA replication and repair protein RecF
LIITNVRLLNFRNYVDENVLFVKGINLITGPNGAGKTNLVEALDYATLGTSFRVNDNRSLIRNNEEKARIILNFVNPKQNEIDITIYPNKKVMFVNNVMLHKVSELQNYLKTLVFTPRDVNFFNETPAYRRHFMDLGIINDDKEYLSLRTDYEKILKARNNLLKEDVVDGVYLDVLTSKLIAYGKEISERRSEFITNLNESLKFVLNKIAPSLSNVTLVYRPSLTHFKRDEEDLKKEYERIKNEEKLKKVTLLGPHRDELEGYLNSKPIATHASQGQKRLIAIALKLAPYHLIKEYHETPVVILDDVLSELDAEHEEKLITYLRELKQVFITTTSSDINANAKYEIKDTHIRRIN